MHKRVGLIGNPVEHSLSPFMQNVALRHHGIDAEYELWHTEAEDVQRQVTSLRVEDTIGANVTIPHKQTVMSWLDDVSPTARAIGAVNTIINDGGRLRGDNTDAYGFQASLSEEAPALRATQAVILGAGGAARAVIVALKGMDFARVVIGNRTPEKAEALAREFGVEHASLDHTLSLLSQADLLVNATSLGWHDESPCPDATLRSLPQQAVVMDLTYRETPLLRTAKDAGYVAVDGLGMLVHQGARSFELWFGLKPPVDQMRDAVLAEQRHRSA